MPRLRLVLFALLAAILLNGSQCRPRTVPASSSLPGELAPIEGNPAEAVTPAAVSEKLLLVNMINGYRAGRGLSMLTWHTPINVAAQGHTDDMVARSYFSNTSPPPNVTTTKDRLAANGVIVAAYGSQEIIARGSNSAASVFVEMQKPGYIQAMATKKWTHLGVGLTSPGNYWSVIYVQLP